MLFAHQIAWKGFKGLPYYNPLNLKVKSQKEIGHWSLVIGHWSLVVGQKGKQGTGGVEVIA